PSLPLSLRPSVRPSVRPSPSLSLPLSLYPPPLSHARRMGRMRSDCIGEPVTSVSMSHDNNCILASSLDGTIRYGVERLRALLLTVLRALLLTVQAAGQGDRGAAA